MARQIAFFVFTWLPICILLIGLYLQNPTLYQQKIDYFLQNNVITTMSTLDPATTAYFASKQQTQEGTTNNGDNEIKKNTNIIINPFEGKDTTILPVSTNGLISSPFNTQDPSNTVVIVGGGLAGLSTAVEVIESYYSTLFNSIKRLAGDSGFSDIKTLLSELRTMPIHSFSQLLEHDTTVYDALHRLALLKVYILDKETNIGGNSAKASSGINAVHTAQQQTWFDFQNRTKSAATKEMTMWDNVEDFVQDTLKSSISPEPPIWVQNNVETSSSTTSTTHDQQDDTLQQLLTPLSPFTPTLIQHVVKESTTAINFLERSDIYQDILDFVQILEQRLFVRYPPDHIHYFPKSWLGSKRHEKTPPKVIQLFLSKITQLGGHSHPRTHRPGPENLAKGMVGPELPVGVATVQSLSNRLLTAPFTNHVNIITGVKLVGLTRPAVTAQVDQGTNGDDVVINGVIYQINDKFKNDFNTPQHDIVNDGARYFKLLADYVVLATGGFSASQGLLERFAPNIAKLSIPTTNGPWAQGDAVDHVLAANGAVVGMDMVQIHPTSFVTPENPFNKVNFLAPEALRGVGGLLFDFHGKRFVNELATRDVAARAIYWSADAQYHMAYLVLSQECAKDFGGAINFYASKGIVGKTSVFTTALPDNIKPDSSEAIDVYKQTLFNKAQHVIENVNTYDEFQQLFSSIKQTTITTDDLAIVQLIDVGLTMLGLSHNAYKIKNNNPNYKYLQNYFILFTQHIAKDLTSYANVNPEDINGTTDDGFVKRNLYTKHSTFNLKSSAEQKNTYFIALITPAIHFTMGGVAIDTNGAVLTQQYFNHAKESWSKNLLKYLKQDQEQQEKEDQQQQQTSITQYKKQQLLQTLTKHSVELIEDIPTSYTGQKHITGLYAVGEASGGVHGRNRLGGNSLLECVTLGRTVGRHIVNQILSEF